MATVEQDSLLGAFEPVTRSTLAEQIVAILKRFILLEGLQVGDKLPSERDLAAALGVSHRVVREALNILTGEGMVLKEHGRGSFVRAFDRQRLEAETVVAPHFPDPVALFEARCAIEVGNMYIVARRATDEDLATLQDIVDDMEQKARQGEGPSAPDIVFHLTLLRATHNETLQRFAYLIRESLRRNVYISPGILSRSMGDDSRALHTHRAIVDALRERDGTKAALAMIHHLKGTLNRLWEVDSPP